MDKNLQIPGLYIIRYQSAPVVPAPFSNYSTLKFHIYSKDEVKVEYSISYTDRDELSEDEIFDEGFTLDDDYKWKGPVPTLWIGEFQSIWASSKMNRQREEKEFEDFIELEFEEEGKRVTVYPVDKERWTYFLQEFTQAIFESAGKEKPFELNYLQIQGGERKQLEFKASFAHKTFNMRKNGGAEIAMDWSQLEKVMNTVYRAEFVDDLALESKPSKNGIYISTEPNWWYEFGVSLIEPKSKSKELPKIEALFANLESGQ